jgi:AraC family transcriptional regulator, regulatory protein of adaptative response / methylated-DNA-[protein]-cysteine methyltransferase
MSTVFAERIVADAGSPDETRFATDTARWEAVCRRNRSADGHFFYSVSTTGVYCRPSCGARLARLEHVAFHPTPADAEKAGFRACRRCLPDLPPRSEREAEMITRACRSIESAEEMPALAELAAEAGVSSHHFHRMFKRITGVTPKSYAAAHRQSRVQASLGSGAQVTEAIYAAGFNSSARFYEAAPKLLGMAPSAYRKGGEGEALWYAQGQCSLGRVLVAATERGVCAILLGDDSAALVADLKTRFPKATLEEAKPVFTEWVHTVVRFIDDPAGIDGLGLPLDIRGTSFQRRVWEILRTVPAGQTVSYSKLAELMGNPRAVRAVAGACAANALAVAIPCHRATAANGELAGYRWGVERKRQLLERERR